MKVKRLKHARKILAFYNRHFDVHKPYQVLGKLNNTKIISTCVTYFRMIFILQRVCWTRFPTIACSTRALEFVLSLSRSCIPGLLFGWIKDPGRGPSHDALSTYWKVQNLQNVYFEVMLFGFHKVVWNRGETVDIDRMGGGSIGAKYSSYVKICL